MGFACAKEGESSRGDFDKFSRSGPWEMTNSTNPAQAEPVEARALTLALNQ